MNLFIVEVDRASALPAGAPAAPKLFDQIRARIRGKHYSIRTEDQYVFWILRFIFFFGEDHLCDIRTE